MNTVVIVVISFGLAYIVAYRLDPMLNAIIQKDILKKKKVEESSPQSKSIAFILCGGVFTFLLSLLFD